MKTNLSILRKIHLFSFIGIASAFIVSCGSYQNTSYYDNDGIYGASERNEQANENKYSEQNMEQSNRYAQQFKNMQDDYTYFTDVEEYTSETNDTVVTVYRNNYSDNNERYASWGSNSSDVSINYYNTGWNNWYSPYWGMGWGNNWYGSNWGWNSWYGPNWGWNNWGWNNWYGPNWGIYYGNTWGWGGYYNNPYYYGGYYGRNGRNLAYNSGTRGGNSYYNNRNGSRYSHGRTSYATGTRNGTISRTRTSGTRTNNYSTPRSTYSTPRNSGTRSESYSTPRSNSSSPRNSGTRSNTYSTPRSSSGSSSSTRSSSSGGRSSGGGGRSSGGRGGRG